jgi:hypothetical protein
MSLIEPCTELLERLRNLLLVLIAAEIVGMAAELMLISHWEDSSQRTPLIVLTLGLAVLAGYAISRNRLSLRAFRLVMWLFLLSGCLGLWLHYHSRAERFRADWRDSVDDGHLLSIAVGSLVCRRPTVCLYRTTAGRHPAFLIWLIITAVSGMLFQMPQPRQS